MTHQTISESQQRLHRLGPGQQGEVTAALRQLPAAGVHDAVHPQQPEIRPQVRTR